MDQIYRRDLMSFCNQFSAKGTQHWKIEDVYKRIITIFQSAKCTGPFFENVAKELTHSFLSEHGISENIAGIICSGLYEDYKVDPLLGLRPKHIKNISIALAHLYAQKTQQPVALLSFDFNNLKGTNIHFLSRLSDTFSQESPLSHERQAEHLTDRSFSILSHTIINGTYEWFRSRNIKGGAEFIRAGGDEMISIITGVPIQLLPKLKSRLTYLTEHSMAEVGMNIHEHHKEKREQERRISQRIYMPGLGVGISVLDLRVLNNEIGHLFEHDYASYLVSCDEDQVPDIDSQASEFEPVTSRTLDRYNNRSISYHKEQIALQRLSDQQLESFNLPKNRLHPKLVEKEAQRFLFDADSLVIRLAWMSAAVDSERELIKKSITKHDRPDQGDEYLANYIRITDQYLEKYGINYYNTVQHRFNFISNKGKEHAPLEHKDKHPIYPEDQRLFRILVNLVHTPEWLCLNPQNKQGLHSFLKTMTAPRIDPVTQSYTSDDALGVLDTFRSMYPQNSIGSMSSIYAHGIAVNIDNLSVINDTSNSYHAGDNYLKQAADTIRSVLLNSKSHVSDQFRLYHFGGGDFVVLMPRVYSQDETEVQDAFKILKDGLIKELNKINLLRLGDIEPDLSINLKDLLIGELPNYTKKGKGTVPVVTSRDFKLEDRTSYDLFKMLESLSTLKAVIAESKGYQLGIGG